MIEFPKDWKEFLELLNSNNVRYALVGGYAVVFHGYVRATNDLDILIARDEVNAKRALKALKAFGFDDPKITRELLLAPEKVIQLGIEPYRIDLITGVPGIEFEDIEADFEKLVIDETEIPVISLEALVLSKKATSRARDLADIEELEKLKS